MSEVAHTAAWRVPRGAQLIGGSSDGLTVIASLTEMFRADGEGPFVIFLLSDGSQRSIPSHMEIAWLHPERRTP